MRKSLSWYNTLFPAGRLYKRWLLELKQPRLRPMGGTKPQVKGGKFVKGTTTRHMVVGINYYSRHGWKFVKTSGL